MRLCTTCGNEIAVRSRICPFCERPQPQAGGSGPAAGSARPAAGGPARRRGGSTGSSPHGRAARRGGGGSDSGAVPTINLKERMPTAAEAVGLLELRLQSQRATGTSLIRVVHGWGSTGHGGAIAAAVRQHLRGLQARGLVRSFLAGEDYSEFTEPGRALRERHPGLQTSFSSDRLNRGITFVEL
jgi:hypothetical protein